MERDTWGTAMRGTIAFLLPSVLCAAACATTIPIDVSELEPIVDGGLHLDGALVEGSGGFAAELGASANGGFQTSAGGFTTPETGGRPAGFPPIGAGGRTSFPGSGGAAASTGNGGSNRGRGGTTTASGGAPSAPGGAMNGAGGASCREGEKVCGGVCVSPAPRTGCGTSGCNPCTNTAPANGVVVCNNGQCDFSCLSGYTKTSSSCMAPAGSGGSTSGGGGTPGPAVTCGGTTCPSCSVILGPACCNGNKCGCPLVPWTAGFLGCI